MTLNRVVLPAPFGPISAVIDPSLTSRVAPSTARMPPNRLTTCSASRIGRPLPKPASITKHHLLPLAKDSLRAECHEENQDDADDDEPKGSLSFGGDR